MAINLENEKSLRLSAQERYDIIDFAIQAAEDNGFMNGFIFERALWLFAAIRLYEDRKNELSSMIAANLLQAWDDLVQDGTMEQMVAEYKDELDTLALEAFAWYTEFYDYAHSARGLVNMFQQYSGNALTDAVNQFQAMQNNGDFQNVLDIAKDWGMENRPVAQDDSLFEQN